MGFNCRTTLLLGFLFMCLFGIRSIHAMYITDEMIAKSFARAERPHDEPMFTSLSSEYSQLDDDSKESKKSVKQVQPYAIRQLTFDKPRQYLFWQRAILDQRDTCYQNLKNLTPEYLEYAEWLNLLFTVTSEVNPYETDDKPILTWVESQKNALLSFYTPNQLSCFDAAMRNQYDQYKQKYTSLQNQSMQQNKNLLMWLEWLENYLNIPKYERIRLVLTPITLETIPHHVDLPDGEGPQ